MFYSSRRFGHGSEVYTHKAGGHSCLRRTIDSPCEVIVSFRAPSGRYPANRAWCSESGAAPAEANCCPIRFVSSQGQCGRFNTLVTSAMNEMANADTKAAKSPGPRKATRPTRIAIPVETRASLFTATTCSTRQ